MRLAREVGTVVGILAAALLAVAAGAVRQRRRVTRHAAALRHAATARPARSFVTEDVEGLPDPVRDYFRHVLEDGRRDVGSVRLEQTGSLRTGGPESSWVPFTATQYITTDPPGFLWSASVRVRRLVRVDVLDRYREGRGRADVTLFGLVDLDGDEGSAALNRGALLRYLAEGVWYPTALLPGRGVRWEGVDDRTARATLECGSVAASLTFHFTDDDEVSRVHAERRPRRVDGGYEPTPWTGRWRDYETRNGIRVPTGGEAVWHLPDGDVAVWRGRLDTIGVDVW
jgi:hypothetical protein